MLSVSSVTRFTNKPGEVKISFTFETKAKERARTKICLTTTFSTKLDFTDMPDGAVERKSILRKMKMIRLAEKFLFFLFVPSEQRFHKSEESFVCLPLFFFGTARMNNNDRKIVLRSFTIASRGRKSELWLFLFPTWDLLVENFPKRTNCRLRSCVHAHERKLSTRLLLIKLSQKSPSVPLHRSSPSQTMNKLKRFNARQLLPSHHQSLLSRLISHTLDFLYRNHKLRLVFALSWVDSSVSEDAFHYRR